MINLFRPKPKTLYLIRGLPGSGKSTLATQLTPWNVAADDCPGLYNADGSYNLELQGQAHLWCLSRAARWMQRRKGAIAVHNTFTQLKYMQPYIDLAKSAGYRVSVVHCENTFGSVHNVPQDVIDRMASNWENFTWNA